MSEAKEQELRQVYRVKYASAVNLELYKTQMAEMEQTFSYLLKQLPATHEMPGLLDDITFAGTSTGLTLSASIGCRKLKRIFTLSCR